MKTKLPDKSYRNWSLLSLLILTSFFLTGCPSGTSSPSIKPAPADPGWSEGTTTLTLTAEVNNPDPSKYSVDAVTLVISRLGPVAIPDDLHGALNFQASRSDNTEPEQWTATMPADFLVHNSEMVWYQWKFSYTDLSNPRPNTGGISFPQVFQVGCQGIDSVGTLLRKDEAMVFAKYSYITRVDQMTAAGYGNPTHGFVCLKRMGVAFASGDPHNIPGPQPGAPAMLIFAPNPATHGGALEDAIPDEPYTLIGYVYGKVPYDSLHKPTELGCMIPWQDWFIHEAGWHPSDGGFIPTPPSCYHFYPVGGNPLNPPRPGYDHCPPPSSPIINPVLPQWHGRVWDIHIWHNPSGGEPGLGIFDFFNRIPEGKTIPNGSFFYPQDLVN